MPPLPIPSISPLVKSADAAALAQRATTPPSGPAANLQTSPSVRLVRFGGSGTSIREGESVALGVLLSEPVDQPMRVTVAVVGGTATFEDYEWCTRPFRSPLRPIGCPSDPAQRSEPDDYSQPSITFEVMATLEIMANRIIRLLDIFTFDDSVDESDETIVVEITSVSAGLSIDHQNATISITITDNDAFGDTADHFASEYIENLADLNILEDTDCTAGGEPMFCPNEPIPRWVMAVWMVRLIDRTEPRAVAASRFSDIDPSLWWSAHVERFAQLGITYGFPDGTFRPSASVTRAHMAAFITRAYELPFRGARGFIDTMDSFHRYSIDRLAASGVTHGCRDGSMFCPGKTTTRGEMAAFLVRASRWEESYRTQNQSVLDHIESTVQVSVQFDSALYTATMSSPRVTITVSLDRDPQREFTLDLRIGRLTTTHWHTRGFSEHFELPDAYPFRELAFDEDSLSASVDIDVSDWFPENYLPEKALILSLGTSSPLPRVSRGMSLTRGANPVAFVRVLEEPDQLRPDQTTEVMPQAESDLEKSSRIQAIHAIPIDKKSDFSAEDIAQYEHRIATVISEVQWWYRTQTDGRHPVFRRDTFDISVETVILSKTVSELEGYSNQRLVEVIRSEGRIAAATPTLIVLNGRHGSGETAGWASYERSAVVIPTLNLVNSPVVVDSWPWEYTYLFAHELAHLLGAVESCAPNEGRGAHVLDDRRDLLYAGPGRRDWSNLILDVGRDDYYMHGRSGCRDISEHRLLGTESLHLPTTPYLHPYRSLTATHMIVRWFPPDREARLSYKVEYRQLDADRWNTVDAKFVGSEYAIIPLIPLPSRCTKYEVRVVAHSQLGTSKHSYSPIIEQRISEPRTPSLRFDSLSKRVWASWPVTASNFRNSVIQYRKQGETWQDSELNASTQIAGDGSLENTHEIPDVEWDAQYEYRVAELIEECSQVVHSEVRSFVPRTMADS